MLTYSDLYFTVSKAWFFSWQELSMILIWRWSSNTTLPLIWSFILICICRKKTNMSRLRCSSVDKQIVTSGVVTWNTYALFFMFVIFSTRKLGHKSILPTRQCKIWNKINLWIWPCTRIIMSSFLYIQRMQYCLHHFQTFSEKKYCPHFYQSVTTDSFK